MPDVLIATDLDGTLWDSSLICHADTLKCISKLQQKGANLIAVTARNRRSAETALMKNRIKCDSIFLNGCICIDSVTKLPLFEHHFSIPAAKELNLFLRNSACKYEIYYLDTGCLETDVEMVARDRKVASFAVHGQSERTLNRFKSNISPDLGSVEVSQDVGGSGVSLMIQPPNVSKASSLQNYIDQKYQVKPYVIAVGDGLNDIEMMKNADFAVACGNDSRVVAVSDDVIGPPDIGGWSKLAEIVAEIQFLDS